MSTISVFKTEVIFFKRGWSLLTKNYRHNEIDDVIYSVLKKPGSDFITPDDFLPVLEDIVVNHPALQFLEDNVNFQERYSKFTSTYRMK